MKKYLLVALAISAMMTNGSVAAQSLDCEMLKEEILRQHRQLTTDQCGLKKQECMNRARNPFDPTEESYARARCMTEAGGCSLGRAFIDSQWKSDFEKKRAIYREQCE